MTTIRLRLLQSLFLCAALALAGSVQAKPAKESKTAVTAEAEDARALLAQPFVTVNGEPLPNAWAEVLLREQRARGADDTPKLRNAVRQNLVALALMVQEARKAALHKTPLLQAQMELAQQNLLVQAWQQKMLADHPPLEGEIKAEYERQLASLGNTDYRLRHILVKDEATAKGLIEKVKAGAKLADLALENSLDAQTRERGGASDWTNVSMLLPLLVEAIKPLANGQLAPQPVKTDAGWHVLQREESRPTQTMSYEQAIPQMQAIVARRILDQQIKALMDSAKVK